MSLFSIESPSGFADGALEVVDAGLCEAMAEVVWVKVLTDPVECVYGRCWFHGDVWVSILL